MSKTTDKVFSGVVLISVIVMLTLYFIIEISYEHIILPFFTVVFLAIYVVSIYNSTRQDEQ